MAALAAALAWRASSTQQGKAVEPPSVVVDQGDLQQQLLVSGVVHPRLKVDVSAQVSRVLAQRHAIASISLLAGGVGVMNMMRVTVSERTFEIGIRMAGFRFKHVPLTPLRASRSLQPSSGWWGELQDPALNIWMKVALTRNRDLVRSVMRLQQASSMAGRAELDAWPNVRVNLGTLAQQSLAPALRSAAGMVTGRSAPAQNKSNFHRLPEHGRHRGLSGSCDVDLWGRVSQNTALAQQDSALARADLLAARWLLSTQVAEQYWTLAAIDAKAPLLARAAQDACANLAATQLRLSVGKSRLTNEHKALASLSDAISACRPWACSGTTRCAPRLCCSMTRARLQARAGQLARAAPA